MEAGDIILAKKAINPNGKSKGQKIRWSSVTAKGHFICVLLGYLKPKDEGISNKDAKKILLKIGWIPTDDIFECLGKAQYKKLEKFLLEKYNDQTNN